MKILLVTSGYPPERLGGAGFYVKYLAEELSKRHEVHLFIPSKRGDEWVEGSIHVHAVRPVKSYLSAVLIERTYRNPEIEKKFKELVECLKPDVVHFHNLWAFRTAFLPVIAKEAGSATVQTLHDYWFICPINIMSYKKQRPCEGPSPEKCSTCWNHVISEYLEQRKIPRLLFDGILKIFNRPNGFELRLRTLIEILNSMDAIIAPSKFLRNMFVKAGVDDSRLYHIPNGYPHEIFKGFQKNKDTNKLVFGFVGVPSYQKGTHVAVKAVRAIKGGDFEFRIYGGGGRREYLSELMKLSRGDDRIRFMGKFDSVVEPYSKIDVLLFPSLWYENCPLVLAEASLTGTPVIASNLGAIPEFVHPGINGFLFTPGSWEELSHLMKGFIENPELVDKLSNPAFVPDDMPEHAKKILKLYESLM
ncbi:glycosyltransferase family 4 protein [Thermococcus sp.]|uniref:glycosyltransferase family 4 protein n=1 Tax=Thermococcus sp. TaxID=35749 RepID=UPI002635B443|nr:glycosyltransferase family 4 protein [Thermococcus sp.]